MQGWPWRRSGLYEQPLVSLKIKETVDAEGWCTKAVETEGGSMAK